MTKAIIGYDPGFGGIKAVMVNGVVKATCIPSVVGVGNTSMGLLDQEFSRSDLPNEVCFEGHSYLVGNHVADYARPIERMDWQRLASGLEAKAFFYTALHELLVGSEVREASVMVGLPVEVMANRTLVEQIREELSGWMQGEHAFSVNRLTYNFNVDQVRVMPQPLGGYFSWGMNDAGQWSRSTDNLRDQVAICDVGMNTLDLYVVKGGKVQRRFVGGDTLGMRRAAEVVQKAIRTDYDVNISIHDADALLREESPMFSSYKGVSDLTALVEQARSTVTSGVLQFLENQWGNGRRFRHVLFTGGGSESLRRPLLRAYPHGLILKNPVLANAHGFAKYGLRAFRS